MQEEYERFLSGELEADGVEPNKIMQPQVEKLEDLEMVTMNKGEGQKWGMQLRRVEAAGGGC